MRTRNRYRTLICGAFFACMLLVPSWASEVAAQEDGFYTDKTLNVIIRSGPGGGNDFYGRLIARHMPRHLPGIPDSIATNMPGAGGIVAANYIANRAERDGTEIAILSRAIAIVQRTDSTGVNYDVRKLIPLGSIASTTAVMVANKDYPVDSLAQLKTAKDEIRVSTTGPGGGAYQRSMLLKLDGYPVNVVTGYIGTDEKILALARGEVDGTFGSYSSLKKSIEEEGLKVITYLGNHHPALSPDLREMREALSPKVRPLASFLAAPLEAGRPFFIPPEVPEERVELLRNAFKSALQDPKLLGEAKRADRSISWTNPKQMEKTYQDILDADDDVIAQFKKLM